MRTADKKKNIMGNSTKTINFEKIVLEKLEERSKKANTSVSKLVNLMCRRIALSDEAYHQEMMRYHWKEFQEHKYMKETMAGIDPVKEELDLMKEGRLER